MVESYKLLLLFISVCIAEVARKRVVLDVDLLIALYIKLK